VQRRRVEDGGGNPVLRERLADRVAPLAADGELVIDVPAPRILRGELYASQLLAVALSFRRPCCE